MSKYNPKTQENHYQKFLIEATKILSQRRLSERRSDDYKNDLVNSYNSYIEYLEPFYKDLSSLQKTKTDQEIKIIKQKLRDCYNALKISYKFPEELLESIIAEEFEDDPNASTFLSADESSVTEETSTTLVEDCAAGQSTSGHSRKADTPSNPKETEAKATPQDKTEDNSPTAEKPTENQPTAKPQSTSSNPAQPIPTDSTVNNSNKNRKDKSNTMEEAPFLALAAKQLHQVYSGNPLELNAFINSINLLKTVGGDARHPILKTFVLTKLSGKALESIPADPANVDAIITALRTNIKPDSSKVVEGKMMALKMDNTKSTEFTKEAEQLAEAFQRSLVIEGIPQAKAKSMAVEKTVEMCRQTAKSNLIKSVMASSTFNDPQEVVAKFVVESANDTKDKQIFKFGQQKDRNGNRNFYNNNWRGNNSNFRGGYNSNWRNNNFANQSGRNNNWRKNRGRGRGRYYNNNNNNQNDRFVRVTNSGNSEDPSGDRRETNEAQVTTFQRVTDN